MACPLLIKTTFPPFSNILFRLESNVKLHINVYVKHKCLFWSIITMNDYIFYSIAG